MTTSPVTTLTDELLAELEESASNATEGQWVNDEPGQVSSADYVCDGVVMCDHIAGAAYGSSDPDNARYIAMANPENVTAIITELRRLRAENAELAQSLAESRANDQAAMGWLTSLRCASGDQGERMLPELVAHIEELKRDAERYRWLRYDALGVSGWAPAVVITDGAIIQQHLEDEELDAAIDAAMQNQ